MARLSSPFGEAEAGIGKADPASSKDFCLDRSVRPVRLEVAGNWVLFSSAALTLWGLWGVVLKYAESQLGEWYKVYVASNLSVVIGVLVVILLYRSSLAMPLRGALAALAAGALGTLGYAMLVLALKNGGPSSAVIAITALYPAITAALARALLGEHLQTHQMVGIGLAVVSVILISCSNSG